LLGKNPLLECVAFKNHLFDHPGVLNFYPVFG
jgi:hypothetical protein